MSSRSNTWHPTLSWWAVASAVLLLVTTIGVSFAPPIAAASQNEIVIDVTFDGTSPFDSGDPTTPSGSQPEPHTPGSDGGSTNGVVRTYDTYGVQVDWNINEDAATGVALTVTLPSHSEWVEGSDGRFPGCDPVTTTTPDPQTLVCELEDQTEGSNGNHRFTARLLAALDNTTFNVTATLTTDDDATGIADTLDDPLTVSEAPRADIAKHTPEVSAVVNDGVEDGVIVMYPVSIVDLGQDDNPPKGSGPIDDAIDIAVYDHVWDVTPSATLATPAQFALSGFAGTNCGVYAGTGAYTTASETWTCGTVSSGLGYDVIPVTVSGYDSTAYPATLADGSTNGPDEPMFAAGQIALWLPEAEIQTAIADPGNESAVSAQFYNSITGDDTTTITGEGDIIEPSVTGTSSTTNIGPTTNNTAEVQFGDAGSGGSGGSGSYEVGTTHNVYWYPGPLQLAQEENNGAFRQNINTAQIYEGGLFVLNDDWDSETHSYRATAGVGPWIDLDNYTSRGATLTIETDVFTTGDEELGYDAPLHGCVAFDTSHYGLSAFGNIDVRDEDDASNSHTLSGPNSGPLAHALVGQARDFTDQSYSGNGSRITADPAVPWIVEFTDAPLQVHSGSSFGVDHDQLTCDDADAGPSGWVAGTDTVSLADFDDDGDGVYEEITRARYRTLEPMVWGGRNELSSTWASGIRVFFQAQVSDDLAVTVDDSELMVLMGHSFGELSGGTPNMELNAGAGAAADCAVTEPTDWVLTGNDLATTTSWCNNGYQDDGVDSFDVSDTVDWDNDAATELRFGRIVRRASGAMARVVAAELAIEKENVNGAFDVKDIGDLVQFSIAPNIVGSPNEALTNVVMVDSLPSYYEFVRFVQLPTTPGATCGEAGGTITCTYSEPVPGSDTGALPDGLPGGWPTPTDGSSEVIIEVRVTGTTYSFTSFHRELSNSASVTADGVVGWDPGTDSMTGPVVSTSYYADSYAFSYLPLGANEGAIIKAVDTLEGPCTRHPSEDPLPADWAARCSMINLDDTMSFLLSLTNEGNTRISDIEIVDVFPHNADGTEPASGTHLVGGSPQTHGDGRAPATDRSGSLSFVSLTGVTNASNLTTWVTGDDPTTISRDPDVTVGQGVNTWCDTPGGIVQSGSGSCPATAADVTATYSLLPNNLFPEETIELRLTLDSQNAGCTDIWTNTFGARYDEVLLPIRSNDVSIMVNCQHDLALTKQIDPAWTPAAGWVNPGSSTVDFMLEVTNQGDPVEDFDVTDYVDTSFWSFEASDNPGGTTGGSETLPYTWDLTDPAEPVVTVDGVLPNAGTVTIPVTLTVQAYGALENYAEISRFDNDGDPSNGDSDPANPNTPSTGVLTDTDSTPDATSGGTDGEDLAVNMVDDDISGDGTAGGDEDDHDIAVVPVYDLTLINTRSAGEPYTLDPGAPVASFDITVKNQGTATAYLIDVTNYVPTGASLTGFTADGGGLVSNTGPGTYQISQLDPGQQVTFQVELTVTDTNVGTYINAAEISAFDDDNNSSNALSPLAVDIDSTPDATNSDDVITSISDPDVADDPDSPLNSHNVVDYDPDGDGNVNEPTAGDEDDHDQEVVSLLATVGDTVWYDTNGDGIQDVGEPGVEGITVQLYNNLAALIDTTTTDVNGNYLFTNLDPGDYTVTFVPPAGTTLAPTGAGSDPAVDSNGLSTAVTLGAGDVDTSIDLGIVPASVGDTVWYDTNGDGIQDIGEPGIEGITVQLYDSLAALIDTTTTDVNGNYEFTNLDPGDYTITFVPTSGSTISPTGAGSDPAVDSNGLSTTTTLDPSEHDPTIDLGIVPASLGDTVWYDTNGDGIQDVGEPGIEGVTIELYDHLGTLIDTDTTDASGNYGFTNLPAGDYTVTFTPPTGTVLTTTGAGGDAGADSNGLTTTVTLVAGGSDVTIDLGIVPASVGDTVWYDTDGDGIQDTGEPGVDGVTVELYDSLGALVDTTTTDASGNYGFTNLPPDDYTVTFVPPTGSTVTVTGAGSDAAADSNGLSSTTTLDPAEHDPTIDLGIVPASLGDRVWSDTNGDGIQDAGETGIEGITVELRDTLGALIETTTTDTSGNYGFTNLDPGEYTVTFVPPTGAILSPTGAGSDPAVDSNGLSTTVTLGASEHNPTIDLGIVPPASIGDTVWNDANGDGIQDPGEPGIEGVTVELRDHTGTIVSTTVTDSSGQYRFTGLPAGDYTVTFTAPTGATVSPTAAGNDPAVDSNGPSSTVTLGAGEDNTSIDVGILVPAPISGTVTIDGTGTPIPGVTIELYDDEGNLVATTVTDNNGDYAFPPVLPGTYRVVELQPNGLGSTTPNELTFSHGVIPTVDVDFVDTAGSISGQVVVDGSGDPLAGVEVTLTGTDANGDQVTLTTTTDANGNYEFTDLLAGDYTVTELQPDGYQDGQIRPDNLQPITLQPGQTQTDVDFSETLPNLAFTGASTRNMAGAGLLLLLIGLAVAFAVGRRRETSAA